MRSKLPVTGKSGTDSPLFSGTETAQQSQLPSPLPRAESFAGLGHGDDHPIWSPTKRAGSRVKG